MKITITILLLLILAVTFNLLFAQDVQSINPVEAKKLMDSKKAIFIDVREKDELVSGTIENSLNIPMSLMNNNRTSFNDLIAKLPLDKEIIVFCRSGRRSGIVGKILKKSGLKVLNLGGYERWKKSIF